MFAKHLASWMAFTADSKKIKDELWPLLPHWNYLLKQLTNHPRANLDTPFIEAYRSKRRYQWEREAWMDFDYLEEYDPIKLDKAILDRVIELKNRTK